MNAGIDCLMGKTEEPGDFNPYSQAKYKQLNQRKLSILSLYSSGVIAYSIISSSTEHLHCPSNDQQQSPPRVSQCEIEKDEDSSKRVVVVDEFLTPAEKLRGVFLQKLNGKAVIESALTDTHVDLTLEVVGEVVNRGNLGGEAMVHFFNWAIKQPAILRDLKSYQVILKALGRRKYFDYMEGILRKMIKQEIKLDFETLEVVMDSFVRARLVSKAVQLFENLEEFGLKRETESLNVLLMCLCRRSHVGTASSVLNSKKGKIGFDRTTFNVIIAGWSKLGRIKEVERFIREMVDDGLSPDCSTFSYLLEGLGRAGQIDDAVEVFGKMSENECMPDTATYNVMISNFVSVGNLDECMKYYRDMTAKNSLPDMNTYTILISAFLKSRRVADALELFDEMLDRGIYPNTGTITSFLEPLCSFGPPHAATIIYKKARKVGCEISLKAYKLLLMRLSRFGKCGMVLKVWDEMQSCGYSSDMEVYEYVVNGLCNIGQLENAVLVMEEALSKGFCPGKIIYSKLNNKLLNLNKVERAYRLFLKVKEARKCENARRYWRATGWHF
ncbi:Pentatricopeptide repeat-containing protein [Thalictrum thalictroides]|uniref:Pentatricopeptide repeat-containing protein n=1 Tax=Thalictrum thalictroides TaxID=46969 RepID=A0A7J6WU68_THATH|nr:Pentatricopeptide repeat-containing protein [Thalictrum thalictroides]